MALMVTCISERGRERMGVEIHDNGEISGLFGEVEFLANDHVFNSRSLPFAQLCINWKKQIIFCIKHPQNVLKDSDFTGDPQNPFLLKPELFLSLFQQDAELLVTQVLCGDDKPLHLLTNMDCYKSFRDYIV